MNNVALYVVAVLIWGSTWLAIEFQLGVVEPEVSIVYRYALAAGVLFAWSGARGLSLRFPWRAHLWFALLGILLFSLNYILAYRAQVFISSALCAIAFSMILWMNIVNARVVFGVQREGKDLEIVVRMHPFAQPRTDDDTCDRRVFQHPPCSDI